jgi:hypothetical protein
MSTIPTTSQKTIEEMETWELCHDAIPRGESDEIAKLLRRRGVSCNGQIVRSWRNDPDVGDDSDTDPIGRRNPVDEFLDFLRAVGARSAEGAAMLRKKVDLEDEKIQADHGREEMLKDREAIKKARQKAQEFLSITEAFGDG